MSNVQRIAKNAGALYASYILTSLLGLVLTVAVARELGDAAFGRYSFAVALTAIFAVFLDMGFDTLIVRDVARDRTVAEKYLGNIIVMKVLLSVVVFGMLALTITLMDYPHETTIVVLVLGGCVILHGFGNVFRVTFRAFERMEYEGLMTCAGKLMALSLALSALFLGYGLVQVALAIVGGGIVEFLLGLCLCSRKFVKLRLEIDLEFWKKALKAAVPIGFLSIAAIVYVRADIVMLSAMKGDAVVGWYNAAYILVLALKPFPHILMSAAFPFMARSAVSSRASLTSGYQKSLRYLLIIGLPAAVGMTILAGRIVPLLYGDEFSDSVVALQILAWDLLLFFLYMPLAFVLVSLNRQNKMAVVVAGCTVLNVVLNLILIPHFSYVGAGIATLVTEGVLLATYFFLVSRYLNALPLYKLVARPIVACAMMAMLVYCCNGMNLAIVVLSAAALYFVALCGLRELTSEDMDFLRSIVKAEGHDG